jgi:hypothetical protein
LPKTENKIRGKEKPSYKKRNFSKKGKKLRKDEISLRHQILQESQATNMQIIQISTRKKNLI